jgi:hypothetical protein
MMMCRYMEEEGVGEAADAAELEADERTVEEQAKFERAYNFRFEEPDDEFVSITYSHGYENLAYYESDVGPGSTSPPSSHIVNVHTLY